MVEALKEKVLKANLQLYERKLALYTWGNASGIDRDLGRVVIKPSGVPYADLEAKMMVVVDLDGALIEGGLRPSSDTPTHLELYRNFPAIGGVVHTHSPYATAWAQAHQGLPCYGTTHADYFHGEIPCTRQLTEDETGESYERNIGQAIVELFRGLNYLEIPAALVAGHGPFTWGRDALEAVENSAVLEEVAKIGLASQQLGLNLKGIPRHLMDRHFFRKHGKDAYYGQNP